jgi:tRNA (guanine37-N1)-methyltransferase
MDVVYDVMAGIGPFAVPAAKKKCSVLANDLNPESYKWLQHNIELNKVTSHVQCFNLDGRDFIRQQMKVHLMKKWKCEDQSYSAHVLMNLPALAIEFLDAFHGLFEGTEIPSTDIVYPMVHCYSFCSGFWGDDMKQAMLKSAAKHLCHSMPADASIRLVRNVAPGKEMVCIEFRLTKDILCAGKKYVIYMHCS